ncbi:MAG: hypothetical protein WCQ47_03685 [bacterium]
MALNKLSYEEQQTLLRDIEKRSPIDALLYRGWILNLNYTINRLLIESDEDTQEMLTAIFWIRTQGLLTEISSHYRKVYDNFDYGLKSGKIDPNNTLLILIARIYNLLEKIKKSLNEEEIIIIDYLRQTHCHVIQKGYQFDIQGNTLKTTYTFKVINKALHLDQIDEIISTYHRRYFRNNRIDYVSMAKDIALKIKDDIFQLNELFGVLNTPFSN